MNFSDTLRGLLRRWYIVLPGLIITAALATGAWFAIPPGYNRSATQLLVPGGSSIPEGGNPYLYLGGLAPAADVLVRAIGSENVLNEVVEEHPGIDIEISRDTTTAGPIILIDVTASSDAAAEEVLDLLIDRTTTVLDQFQAVEDIPRENRMTVIPVTVDEQSVEEPRTRLLAVTGVAILGVVLTLLVAGLVDGANLRRRGTRTASRSETRDVEAVSVDDSVDETARLAERRTALPSKSQASAHDEPVAAARRSPIKR